MNISWYNKNWMFKNGVRWFRLGRRGRGFGVWEQRRDKAGDFFTWEHPWGFFIPLLWTSSRRIVIMFPERKS